MAAHESSNQPGTNQPGTNQSGTKQPSLGLVGWLRWIWRQLTSMRTALLLLLLLAVAAVPGSIWPQRSVDPPRVQDYIDNNPDLAPILDALGFFDVYSSPWFASIYLLLMVSLVGCLIPRTRQHVQALRERPPRVPRRLERLPEHRTFTLQASPDEVMQAARSLMRSKRFRIRKQEGESARELSAEGGFARETGNLFFHFSLLAVIVFVAVGHLWGWRGEVILPEGETFTNTVAEYDTVEPGPWVDENAIDPFTLTLDELTVSFEETEGGTQFGAPREFSGTASVRAEPDAEVTTEAFGVNNPLSISDTSIFLLGNGYAPVVTVEDADGQILYRGATPFIPQDDVYASTGAIKVPAADPSFGLWGAFLPTLEFDEERGPISTFPDLWDPALVLGLYEGELYPDGRPQSVYTLDVDSMDQVTDASGEPERFLVRPGESVDLPGGGTLSLDEVVRWGGLVMRHDPGRVPVLISSVVLLGSLILMLTVRRRRVFIRVAAPSQPEGGGEPSGTLVTVAGLSKGVDTGLAQAIDRVVDSLQERASDRPDQADAQEKDTR